MCSTPSSGVKEGTLFRGKMLLVCIFVCFVLFFANVVVVFPDDVSPTNEIPCSDGYI